MQQAKLTQTLQIRVLRPVHSHVYNECGMPMCNLEFRRALKRGKSMQITQTSGVCLFVWRRSEKIHIKMHKIQLEQCRFEIETARSICSNVVSCKIRLIVDISQRIRPFSMNSTIHKSISFTLKSNWHQTLVYFQSTYIQ